MITKYIGADININHCSLKASMVGGIFALQNTVNPQLTGMQNDWQKKARDNQKYYKQLLKKAPKNQVLKQLPQLHDDAFEQVDCLSCAACCKNYSPRFKTTDIKRISKHLKLKESVFIDTYLNLDSDGDYVVKSSPCAFLGADNFCSIYDVRPSDCSRFPYTDEDVFIKRQNITLKNSTFCPAVFNVLENLKQQFS